METSTNQVCPRCGAGIPAEAPLGLCPRCVLLDAATQTNASPPDPVREPGPTLERVAAAFPQFELVERIGAGGMGVVFKARQPRLDRYVALKLLSEHLARDPQFAERFHREARVLARLNHPNIVTVHDFGESGGFFFLVMEYVDGVNLRDAMRAGRFAPAEALKIIPAVCDALQFAHEEGVLHRDIKPENLILEASGNAKLMDFGIARPIRRSGPGSTEPGMYLGTPAYSAPEQLAGLDVDHRADIFATGVLLSELFCGQLPFAGRSTVEIYLAQQQGELRAPRSAWPDIAPALEALILRCIELDPARRFPSAAALAEALGGIRS